MRTTSWVLGFGLALAALAVPAGASALSISPTSRVIAAPGTVDYTITNTRRVAVNVLLKFVDYTIAANGRAQFPNTTPPRSARKWLSVSPKAVVLAPGKAATVQVHARLGRAAPPGDWQALLVAQETPTAPSVGNKKKVAVVLQIGVAVTIRVPGDLRRRLVVDKPRRQRNTVIVPISNLGNVREVPRVLVRVGKRMVRCQPRPFLAGTKGYATCPVRLRGRVRVVAIVQPRAIPGTVTPRPIKRAATLRRSK